MAGFYFPEQKFRITTILTAFIKSFAEGHIFAGERHPYWEMVYVMEGDVTVTEDNNIYILSAGNIIFHKPMEFHRFHADGRNGCKLLIISFGTKGHTVDKLGSGVYSLNPSQKETLLLCLESIFAGFSIEEDFIVVKKRENRSEIGELIAIRTLELFLLNTLSQKSIKSPRPHSIYAKNYKLIIDVLNEHIGENLSTEQIAAYCNMGTSNLKKTFNMYSGCGIISYFNNMKIVEATKLLKDGLSINEISERLGFSSPNYFSTVFKNKMGVLPSKYAKK